MARTKKIETTTHVKIVNSETEMWGAVENRANLLERGLLKLYAAAAEGKDKDALKLQADRVHQVLEFCRNGFDGARDKVVS